MLHKKVDELEENCDILKRKASDLQEKLLAKEQKTSVTGKSKDSSKVIIHLVIWNFSVNTYNR